MSSQAILYSSRHRHKIPEYLLLGDIAAANVRKWPSVFHQLFFETLTNRAESVSVITRTKFGCLFFYSFQVILNPGKTGTEILTREHIQVPDADQRHILAMNRPRQD